MYFTFLFTEINCQLESTKFGCLGNDCEEHFLKDFWFYEDVTFSAAESIQKKHMVTANFEYAKVD